MHVRAILNNIKVLVLPEQVAVPKAFQAFDPDGNLSDPEQQASVRDLGDRVAGMVESIRS